MLDVSHLTKRYGKVTACQDISFHLPPGSVTVLLGPNGAGKSTLIKSVTGLIRYEGEIRIAGLPNKTSHARRILGYIPEIPAMYPNLTVSEHMEFLARAYRLRNYRERIDALFTRFELSEHRRKFGDELSKGMQQKLNLCLGFLPEPKVILLDEPMIGLDPHAIKELKALLEEQRAAGNTLLVSTHIIDSVDMLWDRALILQDGVIRADVTRTELDTDGRTLEQLFFAVTEGQTVVPETKEPLPDNTKESLPGTKEPLPETSLPEAKKSLPETSLPEMNPPQNTIESFPEIKEPLPEIVESSDTSGTERRG